MNAHINLDLGAATAAVSTADDLQALHEDFLRVNAILCALVDGLQSGLDGVSRWAAMLDRVGLGWDEAVMRTGIRAAREWAWELAEQAVGLDADRLSRALDDRDRDTEHLGQLISNRWSLFHLANRLVGGGDCRDVAKVVDRLSSARIDVRTISP
jgi:hypothetical protein